MTGAILPLQIHPWPVTPEQVEVVKQAKLSLNLEVKVMPVEAVVGLHARVLALGSLPPWVCDAALVRDPTDVSAVAGALKWLLTAPPEDTSGFMVQDYMETIFGEGVKELPAPSCHCGEDRQVLNYNLQPGCNSCNVAGCHLTEGICFND